MTPIDKHEVSKHSSYNSIFVISFWQQDERLAAGRKWSYNFLEKKSQIAQDELLFLQQNHINLVISTNF